MYSTWSLVAAVCSCVFPATATIAVTFRIKARVMQKMKLGLDDWLTFLSLAFAFSYCCTVLYGSFNASIGQDLSTITPEEFTRYRKFLYVGVIVSHLSYGLVKLAVLQFYKRIFSTPRFRISANITMVFVVAFMVTGTLVQIFSAWPITNWWTPGKRLSINYGAFITSFAGIDLVLDIVILCLPVTVIRKLQINTRKKVLVVGIFWMGFFSVVATAVRLYYGHQLNVAGSGILVTDEEFSDATVNNIIWAEIECCCSIIAACLPTYGPLVRSMALPTVISSILRSIRNSVRRRKGKECLGAASTNKNVWFPLSDERRNFVSAKKLDRSKVGIVDDGETRVERGFATEITSKNSTMNV